MKKMFRVGERNGPIGAFVEAVDERDAMDIYKKQRSQTAPAKVWSK
jgi:hypothetical protein